VNRDQLTTIFWLRWRLTRNQWRRGGNVGAAIAGIVFVAGLILAACTFAGAIIVGLLALGDATPVAVMGAWLVLSGAFLFFWVIGLISELQRSETIDLQRLMHLPVQLGQIFLINYAASHFTMSLLVVVPAMVGLAIGLAFSRSFSMILLVPLALSMVFMITAWTYCLRGWLATLMSNPRRRRAIIMGLTTAFILLAQAPNIYFNVIRRADRREGETRAERRKRQEWTQGEIDRAIKIQAAIPPLWLSVGAKNLAEGRAWPALLGTVGCLALGGLGLRRAYRGTLRFYHGETGGKASARTPALATTRAPVAGVTRRESVLARSLPRVPEQAAAVALATFQSMLRAPEVKMQWATSFVVTVLVGAPLMFRRGATVPAEFGPFVATGVVVFSMFLMVGFIVNQFGFDRDGFRAYVLSPVERWLILLGKNLAALPAAVVSATLLLAILTIWLRLSPLVFLATIGQLVIALCLWGIGGNLLSILVPYRIQPGSMKPTKMPALAMVMLVLSQMAMPLLMSPAFIPPLVGWFAERAGGPPAAIVNFALSVALALVMIAIYKASLAPLGRLLRAREMQILETVSVDVE
jgi:ABC-2 type transport system permease protein